MTEQESTELQEIRRRLREFELEYKFTEAAVMLVEVAKYSNHIEDYLRATAYLIYGKEINAAKKLIDICVAQGAGSDPRTVRLLLICDGALNDFESVNNLLNILQASEEDLPWVNTLLARSDLKTGNKPFNEILSEDEIFSPEIKSAETTANQFFLQATVEFCCSCCNKTSETRLHRSLFQLAISPCLHCFRPYVIKPRLLLPFLEIPNSAQLKEELLAVDDLLPAWCNANRQAEQVPEVLRGPGGNSLFAVIGDMLRHSLGSLYSEVVSKQKLNKNHGGLK